MRNFVITIPDELYGHKDIYVEAEWTEQAVEYYRWVESYDGKVEVKEIPLSSAATTEYYCPRGWNKPLTPKQEIMVNRSIWLKNYLGEFYETYMNGKETPEFIEERLIDDSDDDGAGVERAPVVVAYTNSNLVWGKYPLIIQGIEEK